jgi:UDP-glucuronate decarboxylase
MEDGHRVLGIDNFITGPRGEMDDLLRSGLEFIEMDVRDEALASTMRAFRPEAIYHLACPTGVHNLVPLAFEMLDTCYRGTLGVLEAAREHSAAVLVASSAEVYGDPLVSPQPESYSGNVDQLGPRKGYEEGKRVAESLLAIYTERHGLRGTIARIFNTYGPGMADTDTRVVPAMMRNALKGDPLVVYGDGSQTRCHAFVTDTVRGLRQVLEHGATGKAYNLGSTEQVSVSALAECILGVTGSQSPVEYRPHAIPDHAQRLPDVSRAWADLGWETTIRLQDGLRRTADALAEPARS